MIWFIKASLSLDIGFLKVSNWDLGRKLVFLFKKYLEIFLLQVGFHRLKLGKSNVVLFGKNIYYDSPYGLAGYQSMLVRHQKMVDFAEISDPKTVIDVGANVGFFSLMIRDKFPKAKIYAIEPVPQIFSCLKKNLNGELDKVFNTALSDKPGVLKMSFDEKNSATSSVFSTQEKGLSNNLNLIKVKSKTMDQFCQENKIDFVDLLKIDTEGFEANVLKGAKKSLSKTKYLHIEISIENNSDYTFSQINSLLYSEEYNFQLVCFRNFIGRGEGPMPVGDFLYKNVMLE